MERRGQTIPSPDLVIACCAQRLGAAVLTLDQHFTHIPKLKVYRSLKELK
jgi:predicted nucleic acid-binding protein